MKREKNESPLAIPIPPIGNEDYFQQPISFKDCDNHYELIYTGDFQTVGKECPEAVKVMKDLKDGDKGKELWIYINSYGGDVANLSMILQQVMQYRHRVTICTGSAMSAGFILWACGNEKYASPYSQLMYHAVSSGYEGKGTEISKYGSYIERVTSELMTAVKMNELISEEDMKAGISTEVWYLGNDFIKAGKAKDYSDFDSRKSPITGEVIVAGGRIFAQCEDEYIELTQIPEKTYCYSDLIEIETEYFSENNEDEENQEKEISVKKIKKDTADKSKKKKNNNDKKSSAKKSKKKI